MVAAALGAGGCRMQNPWAYDPPPAVDTDDLRGEARPGRTSIAVLPLANPASSPLPWGNIGNVMSEALRRALLHETDYNVEIVADAKVPMSADDKKDKKKVVAELAAKLDDDHVDYVITGRVSDFTHTSVISRKMRRWGIIGRRTEAVVAIDFRIIDVRRREVVGADYIVATADCSNRDNVAKQYEGVDLSTYLFWNTPLGLASYDAIERVVQRVRDLVPLQSGDPVIAAVQQRRVKVSGGKGSGVRPDGRYFVYTGDGPADGVFDPATGQPLVVRITNVLTDESTGLVQGEPPAGVVLIGALLKPDAPVPPAPPAPPAPAAAAAATPADGPASPPKRTSSFFGLFGG